jgi:diguanylate cyclase (GGDEF)-like protein
MDNRQAEFEYQAIETDTQEIRSKLQQIERRNWWSWWHAVLVTLLLTGTVVSLSLPSLLKETDTFFQFNLSLAVRALVALVLLFNAYTIYQQILIKRLCRQLAEKQIHTELFHKWAMFDPLTGLYNRRFAERSLAVEIERAQRNGHPLTVLLIDLNGFKQINDRYGHPVGDLVLKEFATHLKKATRGSDLAVRVGGDEFMVLLPECHPGQLQHIIGRLGPLTMDWNGQEITARFAVGWKQYELGEQPEDLIAAADRALYLNKNTDTTAPSPVHAIS